MALTPPTDDRITRLLAELPGRQRVGDAIERTYPQAYHETLHLAMYVGAKAREIRAGDRHRHHTAHRADQRSHHVPPRRSRTSPDLGMRVR
ncbi:hypothetical protein OG948_39255 (plasmid) [Embleya sp. NBC_00888]|uniref:hypothetical protein n=1 Tax=Embleya sp. NBC_00888 TaxID=2975960 RepID=UPI002F915A57|nr:hypothetical protein OG948_39255 [Embleya sp. NBC_00888]